MWDVVIIGGSLAGAVCARELTRLGLNTIALERDRFPRPKVCGGFLSPNAVECLDRLDLLHEVRAAGAVEVDHARIRVSGGETVIPLARCGLGISRMALDDVTARRAPVLQDAAVHQVTSRENGFVVRTNDAEFHSRILVDAAGKLSRFTRRLAVPEFGIQRLSKGSRGSALDFWFFEQGYGGAVSVENESSNFCFLIRREAIRHYVGQEGQLCTGPLAYEKVPNGIISIGDAAGMIDPFCGEGMYHALDSATTAAQVIASGIASKRTYAEILNAYELRRSQRWDRKRLIGKLLRQAVRYPGLVARGLRWNPGWFLDRLWDRIPT